MAKMNLKISQYSKILIRMKTLLIMKKMLRKRILQ